MHPDQKLLSDAASPGANARIVGRSWNLDRGLRMQAKLEPCEFKGRRQH